jgi:REP element-mobilizing transposase RayT
MHHLPGAEPLPPMPYLVAFEETELKWPPYSMDSTVRRIVLDAVRDTCTRRRWRLIAAHVRTAHVHTVLSADNSPEAVMNALKAAGSFALNRARPEEGKHKRWSRHGSTRYLWKREDVEAAVDYVLNKQGEPMAVYRAPLDDT